MPLAEFNSARGRPNESIEDQRSGQFPEHNELEIVGAYNTPTVTQAMVPASNLNLNVDIQGSVSSNTSLDLESEIHHLSEFTLQYNNAEESKR